MVVGIQDRCIDRAYPWAPVEQVANRRSRNAAGARFYQKPRFEIRPNEVKEVTQCRSLKREP